MSLLWRTARHVSEDPDDETYSAYDDSHDEHSLHPVFEAAGIKAAPCSYTRCPDWDVDQSDAFDRAESKHFAYRRKGKDAPIERVDLSKPVHGFETTADLHTLRRYTQTPASADDAPHWFRHEGKHYIMDGHHRTAAALRRGDTHLDVHMVDLDKKD